MNAATEILGTTVERRIEIWQDDPHESPREWDNLAGLACVHRRYNLGDENGIDDLWELIEKHPRHGTKVYDLWEEAYAYEACYDYSNQADSLRMAMAAIERFGMEDRIYTQNLYLYDHSGITISTSPFSCGWDSGQVGIAFISLDAVSGDPSIKEIRARKRKTFTDVTRERAANIINCEVSTYDQYLQGDIWGFSCIEKIVDGFGEEVGEDTVDSCGGFYGGDPKENGMTEHFSEEFMKVFRNGDVTEVDR